MFVCMSVCCTTSSRLTFRRKFQCNRNPMVLNANAFAILLKAANYFGYPSYNGNGSMNHLNVVGYCCFLNLAHSVGGGSSRRSSSVIALPFSIKVHIITLCVCKKFKSFDIEVSSSSSSLSLSSFFHFVLYCLAFSTQCIGQLIGTQQQYKQQYKLYGFKSIFIVFVCTCVRSCFLNTKHVMSETLHYFCTYITYSYNFAFACSLLMLSHRFSICVFQSRECLDKFFQMVWLSHC